MAGNVRDPLDRLTHIDELISNGGEISIGHVHPVECAATATATATDEDNCLAMLQRRPGETLYQLLVRLDEAIACAWSDDDFTDEINGPE